MNTKHTPKEWTINGLLESDVHCHNNEQSFNAIEIATEDKDIIIEVNYKVYEPTSVILDSMVPQKEIAEQYAELIASAPDLLRERDELKDLLRQTLAMVTRPIHLTRESEQGRIIEAARKAIEK